MTPRDFALIAAEAYVAKPDIGIAASASRAIVREVAGVPATIIAFPGSDNIDCWEDDFDALPTTVSFGRVHRGFWQAWEAIAADVRKALFDPDPTKTDPKPVIFVGHSLGAAIAIMAAVDFTTSGQPPVAVYGFEPPRVSPDTNIRNILAKVPMSLYKNGNDCVPDVPLFWQHAGDLIKIGKATTIIPNIEDHLMVHVIAALS